jgi:hypothetical protein
MANTLTKQPHEQYPVGIDYTGKAPGSATLSSVIVHARRATANGSDTTLSAGLSINDTSLQIPVNPLKGARLIIEQSTAIEEVVCVTAVTGTGPYTCTLLKPIQKVHASGAAVKVYEGASDQVLTSTVGVVNGMKGSGVGKAGNNGQTYQVTLYSTFSDGSTLEDDIAMTITDS